MSGYAFSYIDPAGIEYALVVPDLIGGHTLLQRGGMRGFGVKRVEVAQGRRPYRDGVTRLGGPYSPGREMQLGIALVHDSYPELDAYNRALSRAVSAYKDPESLGVLKIIRPDGAERRIDCWMVEWPDPVINGPGYAVLTPTFWAELPWFYDPTQVMQVLTLATGGLAFPWTFPITFPNTALDTHIYPNNEGDIETWPTIRVNGPGNHPSLENETTSKTLASSQHLEAGDYLDIDMDAATVDFYDVGTGTTTDVIETLSAASEFWPLARGVNTIHVTMDLAYSSSVQFMFTLLYQSV